MLATSPPFRFPLNYTTSVLSEPQIAAVQLFRLDLHELMYTADVLLMTVAVYDLAAHIAHAVEPRALRTDRGGTHEFPFPAFEVVFARELVARILPRGRLGVDGNLR